jgi:hypothetical protein
MLQWTRQLSHLLRDQTSCALPNMKLDQREAGHPVDPVRGLPQIANQPSEHMLVFRFAARDAIGSRMDFPVSEDNPPLRLVQPD